MIAVVVLGGVELASRLQAIVLPAFLALVLATLLAPVSGWLRRHGWPRALAAFSVLLAFLLVIAGVVAWIVPSVADQLGDLQIGLTGGLGVVQQWLVDGPLALSPDQVAGVVGRVEETVTGNLNNLAQTAVTGATMVFSVLIGLVLAVVVLFFFLKDGDRMWSWIRTLVPRRHREAVGEAGERSWSALSAFLRAQTLVALFDAIFIGLALVITGVPLALPLTVLTFFAAYIPYIGAFSAGAAAVLVALVSSGFTTALIIVGVILLVQQLEGNVIQPVIMGRALSVHPVIILLGVVAGSVLAGIIGAIIATPLLAAASGAFYYVRERGTETPHDAAADSR